MRKERRQFKKRWERKKRFFPEPQRHRRRLPLSYIVREYLPPHLSRCSLDTLSRLGEGFYSCAVFMLFGRSIQQSQTDTNDQCTQPRPRGTLIADQRRAGEARPRGKAGSERRKACFHPGGSGFHLPRGHTDGQGHSQFKTSSFSVHNTGSLLLSSLKKVTSPPSSHCSPSSLPRKKSPAPGWVQGKKG